MLCEKLQGGGQKFMIDKIRDYRIFISEKELDEILAGRRNILLSTTPPPTEYPITADLLNMHRCMRTVSVYVAKSFVGVVLISKLHIWKYNGLYPISSSFMYDIHPHELDLLHMTYQEFEDYGKEGPVYGYEFDTFNLNKDLIGRSRPLEHKYIPIVL